MKKFVLSGAMALAMLMSVGQVSAQNTVGNILSNVLGSTSSSSSTTGSILQGLTTIFNKSNIATKDKIVGTWTYVEPAIVFSSDNVLPNLGGKAASSAIEKRLQSKLNTYGFKKGMVTMTFDKNGNFTQKFKNRTLKGTYTVKDKNVTLKYAGNFKQIVGTTQIVDNSLLIVMDASKLLKYVNVLGKVSGSATLKTATSLLGSMKGMECGLRLQK